MNFYKIISATEFLIVERCGIRVFETEKEYEKVKKIVDKNKRSC